MYLGYQSIELLGHLIEHGKIKPVPGKLEAIDKLVAPGNVRQLKSFLGLVGFYRRFVRKFASIAAPLVELLGKGQEYVWKSSQQGAFEGLKAALK